MMRKTPGRLLSAAGMTALLMLAGGAIAAEPTPGQPAAEATAPPPPQAELLPGLDLYNDADRFLGTVQRVETRDGRRVAIVSVGEDFGWFVTEAVAVPVERIYVDGMKIRTKMSQTAFRNRARTAPRASGG